MSSKRFDRVADIAGADDWQHDPRGTAIVLHFDIAEVLDAADIEGDVTPKPFARWQYRRSPIVSVPSIDTLAERAEHFCEGEWADDYSYGVIALAVAYRDGDITNADLIYAGDVLSRYTAWLDRHGRSY